MKPYREIPLGRSAVTYFRERLSEGKTLAVGLQKETNLNTGQIITFVPCDREVSDEELIQYEHGQLLPGLGPETYQYYLDDDGAITRIVPVPDTSTLLTKIIREFVDTRENNLCILEEGLAQRSDPCVASWEVPWFALNEELYYIATSANTDSEIEQIIRMAKNHYPGLIGAMTSLPPSFELDSHKRTITSEEVNILAVRAEKVILGAYDGQGYLIWSQF